MTNSRIKQIVLRRARFIRVVRPFVSSTALASMLSLGSLYALAKQVWVARVLENMPSPADGVAVLRFFEAAFLNTSFVVQVLSVVLVVGMVWVARNAARNIQASFRLA